jgi:hypothetical protein
VTSGLAVRVAVFTGLTLWTAVLVRLARRYGPVAAVSGGPRTAVRAAGLAAPWALHGAGLLPTVASLSDLLVALGLSWTLYALAVWLVGAPDGTCQDSGTDRTERPAG